MGLTCAGYLSDPPGVLGVETTTLELGPLSASNLLAIDRTQWITSNPRLALFAHQSNWTKPSTVFRMASLWLSLNWGSVSSDKQCVCNRDEGRPISARLWSCLIVMGNLFHCISLEYADGFPGAAEHHCSSLRIPSLNVQFVFGSLRACDPGNLASDSPWTVHKTHLPSEFDTVSSTIWYLCWLQYMKTGIRTFYRGLESDTVDCCPMG